ncbi:MAG: hypothetical protein ACREO3_07720 [Arenimonas sp.]
MATRLYRVTAAEAPADRTRLIRASTRAGAIAHAARTDYIAEVADPEECFDLAKRGVVIEVAGEVSEPPK